MRLREGHLRIQGHRRRPLRTSLKARGGSCHRGAKQDRLHGSCPAWSGIIGMVEAPAFRGNRPGGPSARGRGASARGRHRRSAAVLAIVLTALGVGVVLAWYVSSLSGRAAGPARQALAPGHAVAAPRGLPAAEAGLMPWHLAAPISREVAVAGPIWPADRARRADRRRWLGKRDLRLSHRHRGRPLGGCAQRCPARRRGGRDRRACCCLRRRVAGHVATVQSFTLGGPRGRSGAATAAPPGRCPRRARTRWRSPSARPPTSWAAMTEPARTPRCWPPRTAAPSPGRHAAGTGALPGGRRARGEDLRVRRPGHHRPARWGTGGGHPGR